MKKSRNFISMMLSVGIFIATFSLFCPEGKPRGSEPGREEISPEVEKAYSDAEQAKEEWEKSKDDDPEKIKKESDYEVARLKLKTALIAEADRLEKTEVFNPETNEKEEVDKIKDDKKIIQEKIKQLSEQLGQTYEPPVVEPKVSPKVQDFQENMLQEFAKVKEPGGLVSKFAKDNFDIASQLTENGLPDYESQKQALNALRDFLNNKSKENALGLNRLTPEEKSNYYRSRRAMKDRVAEIDAFQKNPPTRLPDNPLADRLKLSEMIPSDQVKVLKKEFLSIKDTISALQEAIGAFKDYGLEANESSFVHLLEERVKVLTEKPKEVPADIEKIGEVLSQNPSAQELSEALTPEAAGGKGVIEIVSDMIYRFPDGLKIFYERTPQVSREILQDVGRKLAEGGETLNAYAEQMVYVPTLIDRTVNAAQTVEKSVAAYKPKIDMLPGQKARDIASYMAKADTISKKIGANEKPLRTWSERVGKLGKLVGSVAEMSTKAGEYLKSFGKKAQTESPEVLMKRVEDLKKASLAIEMERSTILPPEKKSRLQKIFEPIKNAARDVGSWAKNLFKEKQPTLVQASKNFEFARNDYLSKLGFTAEEIEKRPTPKQMEEKLKVVLANKEKLAGFKDSTKILAKRGDEFSNAYKDVVEKLGSANANMEWLVSGWDAIAMEEKPKTVVDMVNNIVDLRDLRMAYLEAAQTGIDLMQQDIESVTQNTDFAGVAQSFIDTMNRMVNNQMVQTIVDYTSMLDAFDKSIQQERGNLEEYIKEQQTPSGPPPG